MKYNISDDTHYTPKWLSAELACRLPLTENCSVFDPACGTGNLLLAVADMSDKTANIRYVGVDIDKTAISSINSLGDEYDKKIDAKGVCKDFLHLKNRDLRFKRPLQIVMNPPFRGYGKICPSQRAEITKSLNLKGRYNLAHAFVMHAIEEFSPDNIVALLPCTWARSSAAVFQRNLDATNGEWSWTEIDGNPFRVATKVGILQWRKGLCSSVSYSKHTNKRQTNITARVGTATGSDSTYVSLSDVFKNTELGKIVSAVRGRDIGRETSRKLWLPPTNDSDMKVAARKLPRKERLTLRTRSCVLSGKRHLIEFHESVQPWFLTEPKLVLPEIVSGSQIRITKDLDGLLFPLHSTIAVRAVDSNEADALAREITKKSFLNSLRKISPRLQGASFRLTVNSLRLVFE